MRVHLSIIGALTTGLVFLAAAASAVQVPERRTDDQIRMQVEGRLVDRELRGLTVIVHQGQVTLEGMVSNAWERRQAYEEARKVEDVTSVLCNLSIARDVSDTLIAREVERRILEHPFYTIFENIDVRVRHGQVMLRGEVMADARARVMADIAAKVHGVVEVFNFIRTLPFSLKDDEIRYEIAGRLYEDPSSCFQADVLLAPIHIIVEHGHVKLTGTVDSDVERRAVEMIARQALGVIRVENKLKTRMTRLL